MEHRISALPSTVAGIVVLVITVFNGSMLWPPGHPKTLLLIGLGVVSILYLTVFNWIVVPSPNYKQAYSWINAILISIGLGLLVYAVPDSLDMYLGVLLILAVIGSAIFSERAPSYLLIFLTTLITLWIRREMLANLQEWTFHLSIAVIGVIVVETVKQLKSLRGTTSGGWKPSPISAAISHPPWTQSRSWRF